MLYTTSIAMAPPPPDLMQLRSAVSVAPLPSMLTPIVMTGEEQGEPPPPPALAETNATAITGGGDGPPPPDWFQPTTVTATVDAPPPPDFTFAQAATGNRGMFDDAPPPPML